MDPAAGAASPQDRLRWAFAQLMAGGNNKPLTPEALWALQGKQQLGPPPAPLERIQGFEGNDVRAMPQVQSPPGLNFPTAKPGGVLDEEPKGALFPKAETVVTEPSPFRLPPSPKKKAKD